MANKWFAATLGFLVPPLAFLYLAKLRIAAIYLLLLILFGAIDFYITSVYGASIVALLLGMCATVHAFILAKSIKFENKRKWYSKWWGALSIPISFCTLVFLIRSFIVEPFSIPSESMSPSLEIGDYVIVKKWGYGLYGSFGITLVSQEVESRTPLNRGEMAVLIPPHTPHIYVKRIIGISGDVVEFREKQLVINGNLIETTFFENGIVNEVFGKNIATVKYVNEYSPLRSGKWTVPDDHYFVMGDNRDNSADSRMWGMVPAQNVIGRVLIKW